MDNRYFSDKVVEWYKLNKRDLPWRDTQDPYRVWLSEIILQQTRVNQGMPYYFKFLEIFRAIFFLRFLLIKLPKPRIYMLFPFDMELFITLKKASTDAVTSALSTPVFSAISLIMSALVTVLYF